MTIKEYRKYTEKDLLGKKVRSNTQLSNGHAKMPAGTLFTIERKFSGFSLKSDPCSTCGIQIRITKVPPRDVDLVLHGESAR